MQSLIAPYLIINPLYHILINMDYEAEINEIKSKLKKLKVRKVKSAAEEEKIFLHQRILALEKRQNTYIKQLLHQNARSGNC